MKAVSVSVPVAMIDPLSATTPLSAFWAGPVPAKKRLVVSAWVQWVASVEVQIPGT